MNRQRPAGGEPAAATGGPGTSRQPGDDDPIVASYRLQLAPEFGFDAVRVRLPYFRRLGVSHLYLSPITEAVRGSAHGYDVTEHNTVRAELGGREAFEELRLAAVQHGLRLILDIVPNHAGVGPHNEAWQDLLAYGEASPYSRTFDVDWRPLKPELQGKLLLPFLGRPYGEVLDDGEIVVRYEGGYFHAEYFDNRFRLSPASYALILTELLPAFERRQDYFDLLELRDLYAELGPEERDKGQALATRLASVAGAPDFGQTLDGLDGGRLHELLELQNWRLAYWKTASDEINYRRFFDVNGLVALRMEEPEVFWEAHRLMGELLLEEGVDGLRIDHIDGLFDPHAYLEALTALGARRVWVEKILAPGETVPGDWSVCGTTGYEFMNDALRLLVYPAGEGPLRLAYRRFLDGTVDYRDEVVRCKRLVMNTSLAGELSRLAGMLYRLSEADYHTRDFTATALRAALADVIASFDRYRTYLPHDQASAEEGLRRALAEARRRAENVETSAHEFVLRCLLEPLPDELEPTRAAFVGRFQQYTAPVAAKGVEDTAFYRFVPLAALNEVGGEPDHFTVEEQAFHSRARFRQHSYPNNLLPTATHDHKRGEDTRMRLVVLSELTESWQETLIALDERAQRHWREHNPLGAPRVSRRDAYLLFQHLVALWQDERPATLAPRLKEYMRKAVREAKQESSWIDPDAGYEAAVEEFCGAMVEDEEVARIVGPLARELAEFGFRNSLAQLVLKLTTPGVPDIYQGSELMDLSLVDPDNRRPVDFEARETLLNALCEPGPMPIERLSEWLERREPGLKLLIIHRLLRFRREHPTLFLGGYRALETVTDGGTDKGPLEHDGKRERDNTDRAAGHHLLAYLREDGAEQLLALIPRWLAVLSNRARTPVSPEVRDTDESASTAPPAAAGLADNVWGAHSLRLGEDLQGGGWLELISGSEVDAEETIAISRLPLVPAVLYRRRRD
ncbi:MAG: malto-oligosyltrehalose synthase [Trueperaceae bacterium]